MKDLEKWREERRGERERERERERGGKRERWINDGRERENQMFLLCVHLQGKSEILSIQPS